MKTEVYVFHAIKENEILYRKILWQIRNTSFLSMMAPCDAKVDIQNVTKEEFESDVKSSFQEILDMITRYREIEEAIHKANAEITIETCLGEMTISDAYKLHNEIGRMSYDEKFRRFKRELYSLIEIAYTTNTIEI